MSGWFIDMSYRVFAPSRGRAACWDDSPQTAPASSAWLRRISIRSAATVTRSTISGTRLFISTGGAASHRSESPNAFRRGRIKRASIKIERCDRVTDVDPGREKRPERADEEYYGVNAFILVNDKGERHAVHYLLAPEKLVHLAPAEAAKQAPDFLIDELPARIERGA
jgi:hypothetical protein